MSFGAALSASAASFQVSRARFAGEHRTRSGTSFSLRMKAPIAGAAFCPRLLSGRSRSSRPGSVQLDLAWRNNIRRSMGMRYSTLMTRLRRRPGEGVSGGTLPDPPPWHLSTLFSDLVDRKGCRLVHLVDPIAEQQMRVAAPAILRNAVGIVLR